MLDKPSSIQISYTWIYAIILPSDLQNIIKIKETIKTALDRP